jgi:hypothetical protein
LLFQTCILKFARQRLARKENLPEKPTTSHFATMQFRASIGYHVDKEIERSRHRRADPASCGILDSAARACERWLLPDQNRASRAAE